MQRVEHHLGIGDRRSSYEISTSTLDARYPATASMTSSVSFIPELSEPDGNLMQTREHPLRHGGTLRRRRDRSGMQMQRMERVLRQRGQIRGARYGFAELDQHVLCGRLNQILRGTDRLLGLLIQSGQAIDV